MVFTLTNTIGKYAKNPPGGEIIVNWVAVGSGGNTIATSADGSSWRGVTANGGITTRVLAVAYANGTWVAVGDGSNTIATSTNGTTWTGRTQNGGLTNNQYGAGVAYGLDGSGAGLWVAVGEGSNTIATSSDNGVTWIGRTQHGGINSIGYRVVYGNGLWVVVGQGSNSIATSTNGTAWTGVTANGGITYGRSIAFKPP